MPIRSAFFESTGGDRKYTADRWAQIFQAVMTQGYIPGWANNLQVVENSPPAMNVQMLPGAGFIQGRYVEVYSANLVLTIAAAHATQYRRDLVILRLDLSAGVRDIVATVLSGALAATAGAAAYPALTRNATVYEVALAGVLINPADTAIQNADITDLRDNASYWGKSSFPDLLVHKAAAVLDHPDASVTTAKIAPSAVTNDRIAVNTIDLSTRAAAGSLTNDRIAPNTINASQKIQLQTINNTLIADSTIVGDSKIQPSTITGNSAGSAIPSNSIHGNRMQGSTMSTAEFERWSGGSPIIRSMSIHDANVLNQHIADSTINASQKLANGTVVDVKMATNNINGDKIAEGTIAGGKLIENTIPGNKIANATIPASKLASGVAIVPMGAVIWFETQAEVNAAGAQWSRYSPADGRMLVQTGGGISGQNFAEATSFGSNWTPVTGITAGSIPAGSGGTTAQFAGGGVGVASDGHTHGPPAINGQGAVWLPPMRAGVYARRIA